MAGTILAVDVILDEDPVSFLAGIREECPDILSILTTKQVKLLSQCPTDPYNEGKVDEEHLLDAWNYLKLRTKWKQSSVCLRSFLLMPQDDIKSFNTQDLETFDRKRRTLEKVMKRTKLVIDSRLKATEEKLGECYLPRIIRLCRKFKFTENETAIALYCLIRQFSQKYETRRMLCGCCDRGQRGTGSDCVTISQFMGIPIMEVLGFIKKERLHMKQGLFPRIDDHTYMKADQIAYDFDFCKVLMGLKMTDNEFLKLEQTLLADVIAEEPGNKHLKNEDSIEVNGDKKTDIPTIYEGKEQEIKVFDLDTILLLEIEKEKARVPTKEERVKDADQEEGHDNLKPYTKDLEYLDDHFQLILSKLKVYAVRELINESELQGDSYSARLYHSDQRMMKEALAKERTHENLCANRLALTKAAGPWFPRLERMVESRNLCSFEKDVLLTLIGVTLLPNKFDSDDFFITRKSMVSGLLQQLCSSLEERINHLKYFYKSATLIREGMLVLHSSDISGDVSRAVVEVDRRMVDFCVGLDTEFSEVVEGSHLYYPKIKLDQVILPKEQKDLILNTISNFKGYRHCRKKTGLDDAITYGAGMVMLFYGAPGTGKTMMANAVANKLNKKVLLINFPSLGTMSADENFKFIFREAKINDAILFFDECESIFESRDKGSLSVNLLLTEIERHDGLIILATNRPYDLDEAMHRRIMIAIEFRQPDHLLRKAIWESHMPEQMTLADDIDIENLALRFELTGGFIKNAILSALSIAISRDGENPVVGQKDLLQGASLQLRGRLRMKDFDRRVVPAAGLDEVVVEESIMKQLKQIVQFEKARAILFGQWGFAKRNHKGLTVLLHGSPGTGKTLVAEAIGYEVGKALKVVNCGELLSKWVGESSKNIDAIFQEAQHQDAILVFDEAEGLFGHRTSTITSTDRYANVDIGVLLHHIERFSGIVVLTTNLIENVDKAFFRRLQFILHLDIPCQALRAKLWKLIVPSKTPLADDVDLEQLSRHEMSGGSIKNAVYRAAASAALRDDEGARYVTMEDLEEACEEEITKTAKAKGLNFHIYN